MEKEHNKIKGIRTWTIWNDKLLVDTKSTLVFINSFLFYNVLTM